MKSSSEYSAVREDFFIEYERKVRNWLSERNEAGKAIAEKVPFFRDGVVNPDKWFKPGNDFRPLFILKEVNGGFDDVSGLDNYISTWGNSLNYEFAENPFDDIRVGKFNTWRRVMKLALGLKDAHDNNTLTAYEDIDVSYIEGEAYKGDIPGYLDYGHRTANENYNNIVEQIAVINIKKLPGGSVVSANLSDVTGWYDEHSKGALGEMLVRQIELIEPTVVICCGRENGECISRYFPKELKESCIWIDGVHPARGSNVEFYEKPVKEYLSVISQVKE